MLHFDRAVDGGTASLTGNGSVGTVSFNGSDMIIPLTGVTDVQTVTVTAQNVTSPGGGSTLSSASVQIGFLVGDVTGNAVVQAGDTINVRSNSGQAVSGTNFRADVNTDGFVNGGDTLIVRASSGNGL